MSLPRCVCGLLRVEIAHVVEIGDQTGAGRAPSQPFLSLHARTGNVATNEPTRKPKWAAASSGDFGLTPERACFATSREFPNQT